VFGATCAAKIFAGVASLLGSAHHLADKALRFVRATASVLDTAGANENVVILHGHCIFPLT
jgi:hypothetical protein